MATSSTCALGNGVPTDATVFHNSEPLCRCRVLYIGSAVPTITKDGLQGIQQPLKERYPATDNPDTKGIDSWLSVWSNGLLLEYVDGDQKMESAFFPIASLHYCAAVRYVNMTGFAVEGGGERFIPLDSPFAHIPDSPHPPMFAAIFRRTHGVKVLECHAFVCTNEKAANALVRCCFHAYAETNYLKAEEKLPSPPSQGNGLRAIKEPSRSESPSSDQNMSEQENGADGLVSDWNERAIGQKAWQRRQQNGELDSSSLSSGTFRQQHKGRKAGGGEGGGVLVPYEGRVGSRAEPRDFCDSMPRRRPPHGGAFFYAPMPHPQGMFPPPPSRPPPAAFLRPGAFSSAVPHPHFMPPPFFPPQSHRFVPFGPPPPPPHFGRFGHPFSPHPFPPRMFFMPPPPSPFLGQTVRRKSPERSVPIITETVYDTFPRHHSRTTTTYEEPIYMPSSNGVQATYKPGSFSPELYEHYYETYNRQQQRTGGRKNVSRSNSDASECDESAAAHHHYWESYEAKMFQPQQQQQQRRNTPKQQNGGTPKLNGGGKKLEEDGEGGQGQDEGDTLRRRTEQVTTTVTMTKEEPDNNGTKFTQHRLGGKTAAGGEPRPTTPPADYDVVMPDRQQQQNGRGAVGGTMAY
uniref:PID domain-containing protein n=1 Tax=Globodera rostochiensis TaxID=31243 RepID=A0A914HE77_GLORO